MVAIETLDDWDPGPGSVISWQPSAAALAKARQAPVSAVPVSYQQARHLRSYSDYAARGADMARLVIGAWDIPGRCDIRAMTYVINAHLRRHDTYRSWFDYQDGEHIVRHTIPDPADIEFMPAEHGEMTPAEWRDHILATPDPLHWDCFRFGLIQLADHFTFYLSIDHLHVDPMVMGLVFMEIHMMYAALVRGEAPITLPDAGSYDDYCVRQRQYTSALTVESPQVRAWIQFAENNGGSLPEFPLPLGDPSVPCTAGGITVQLMDEQQTHRFESACLAAGARFSGGVFACAALTEHELTGAHTYYGITPTDTRSTPADFTAMGWFVGFVPITVPVNTTSFADTVRAAQASFDSGADLANVPYGRVVELAPWLKPPQASSPMVSYLDGGLAPFSAAIISQLNELNAKAYGDGRYSHRLLTWVNRLNKETTVTVGFPDNPVARESVDQYIAAMKSVYSRIADGRGELAPPRNVAHV